jgi:hypothetical protein
MGAAVELRMDRREHIGIAMTEDQRTMTHRIVDDAFAIEVELVGAVPSCDIDRKGALVAAVVGDAARDCAVRSLMHCLR